MNDVDKHYYFEDIGDNFDRWMSDYDVSRRARLIRKYLAGNTAGKTCLEVGCGTGRISEAIMDLTGSLTVADISEKLARGVGERLHIAWMHQDACALQLEDDSYDVVVSSECIEHTPDPRKALREMARVLKPGGRIIVTTPNKLWYPVVCFSMVTRIRKFSGRENWLFPREAMKTLAEAGIGDLTLDGCHLFPWQLPLAKRVLPLFDRFGESLYPLMINFCLAGMKKRLP
jgi:ubiquinone/menaquinone biosynthesis C-methylase UbiE